MGVVIVIIMIMEKWKGSLFSQPFPPSTNFFSLFFEGKKGVFDTVFLIRLSQLV